MVHFMACLILGHPLDTELLEDSTETGSFQRIPQR